MPKAPFSVKETASDDGRKPSIFDRLGSQAKPNDVDQEEHFELKLLSILAKSKERPVILNKRGLNKKTTMKKSRHSKRSKDKHRHKHSSAKVAASAPPLADSPALESFDFRDLEGADEKFLEKRRLQLQRELRLQLEREKLASKRNKKEKKSAAISSGSSASSSDSSSSSSSSSSSYASKKVLPRKRKASSSSSTSDEIVPAKKRRIPTPPPSGKMRLESKKNIPSPRKELHNKAALSKRSLTPNRERRPSPVKKKSPLPVKSKPRSPKHKPRDPSPRRPLKAKKTTRASPSARSARVRTPDRRIRHSPPRSRPGGLEKGGKILPVKSSAYAKEMKNSSHKRSPSRSREDRERELEKAKERKRREEKVREAKEAERREREREAERVKRENERLKEREEVLRQNRERERERQRERERTEREKRTKEIERRKIDSKNDLPSLLDIKTEVPSRDSGRRGWEDRRPRRSDENFELRRGPRMDDDLQDDRRLRKEFPRDTPPWDPKDNLREPPPIANWSRSKLKPTDSGRESGWRERDQQYLPRRQTPNWRADPPHHTPEIEATFKESTPPEPTGPLPPPIPHDVSADLEEVLSDISDDADEILNQVDDSAMASPPQPHMEPHSPQPLPAVLAQPSTDFFFDSRRPLLECLGDRGLDFEEISDEELEEEAKVGKGIMDVLGADWASLMPEKVCKSAVVEAVSSARRSWQADTIIARIGISRNLAGQSFTDSYLSRLCNQVIVDKQVDEKKEKTDKEKSISDANIKVETHHEIEHAIVRDVKLLHEVAAVHNMVATLPYASSINHLLSFSAKRAMSAHTDLALRRILCGFPAKEFAQSCNEATSLPSSHAFKLAAV